MKKHTSRLVCFSAAAFLLLCAAFSSGAVRASEAETPSTEAVETTPAETAPAASEPAETTPAETKPAAVKLDQPITGVESTMSRSLSVKTFTLKPSAKGKISYKSSNPKIAAVSKKGKVTLLKVGTVTITISAKGTKKYKPATFQVLLTVNPKNISLNYVESSGEGEMEIDWGSADKTITRFEVQAAKNTKFSKSLHKTTVPKQYDGLYWGGFKKGTWYVRCRRMLKKSGKSYYSDWSEPLRVNVKG